MFNQFLKSVGILGYGFFLFGISGCGSVSKNAGVHDVEKVVEEQAGFRIEADREVKENTIQEFIQSKLEEKLTADVSVQIALLNNPSLQAILDEIGIAQADLVQAGLIKNPIFSGHARFPEGSGKTNVEFTLTEDVLDIFLLPMRKRLASVQFEQIKLRVSNEVLSLMTQVKKAYYTLEAVQQIQSMRQTVLQASEMAVELASRQYKAGNINVLDLANERTSYQQAQLDFDRSEADVRVAYEELSLLLGLSGTKGSLLKVAGHLPELPSIDLPLNQLEALAFSQRLDLASVKKEVEVFQRNLSLMGVSVVSSVEIGGSTEIDPDGTRVSGPTWGLELPIFDRRQASVAKIKAQLRQSQHHLAAKENEIRSEIRISLDRMLTARRILEHYSNQIISLREEIVTLTQQHYNYMLKGVYDLLQAKQNEITARREAIEVQRDYWIAHSDLERAVGGRLSESKSDRDSEPKISKPNEEQMPEQVTHHHHGG